eukprot:scaffold365674_cov42-Prasinocladus_malaysianus.AAC.1
MESKNALARIGACTHQYTCTKEQLLVYMLCVSKEPLAVAEEGLNSQVFSAQLGAKTAPITLHHSDRHTAKDLSSPAV